LRGATCLAPAAPRGAAGRSDEAISVYHFVFPSIDGLNLLDALYCTTPAELINHEIIFY